MSTLRIVMLDTWTNHAPNLLDALPPPGTVVRNFAAHSRLIFYRLLRVARLISRVALDTSLCVERIWLLQPFQLEKDLIIKQQTVDLLSDRNECEVTL